MSTRTAGAPGDDGGDGGGDGVRTGAGTSISARIDSCTPIVTVMEWPGGTMTPDSARKAVAASALFISSVSTARSACAASASSIWMDTCTFTDSSPVCCSRRRVAASYGVTETVTFETSTLAAAAKTSATAWLGKVSTVPLATKSTTTVEVRTVLSVSMNSPMSEKPMSSSISSTKVVPKAPTVAIPVSTLSGVFSPMSAVASSSCSPTNVEMKSQTSVSSSTSSSVRSTPLVAPSAAVTSCLISSLSPVAKPSAFDASSAFLSWISATLSMTAVAVSPNAFWFFSPATISVRLVTTVPISTVDLR